MRLRGVASDTWTWPQLPAGRLAEERASFQASAPARDRVKVLHVITKFVDGAGGNTLLSVLGADQRRFEVWVAGAPGGPLWSRAEGAGVKTVHVTNMRAPIAPLRDLRAVFELFRLMRRERFTIVHTHSSKAGFVGRVAAFLSRTPIVVHTIHGFSWHDYMTPARRSVYVLLERLVRPVTDAFLAVAPQVANEAVAVGVAPASRVSVVPSAVELSTIPDAPDPHVRDELGVAHDVPLVGTVGRLDFQKAPLDFIRMASHLGKSWPDARFVMVGEGELLDEARAESARLGVDVHFTGYRSDASRVAAAFDVYVVSSVYEGLGRSLCEALASGRPVVATSVNGVVDVVEPGVTGLLASPRSPRQLAECVSWLLDNPDQAKAMGEAGRERVRRLFDPALMCDLIDRAYMRLLEPNPTGSAPSSDRRRSVRTEGDVGTRALRD
jgi:glycosyltransferase involved in cell wall biosynthesis